MVKIQTLTNAELLKRLPELCAKEREATLELLWHLIELDRRRLYLEAGYSSLFDYCTRKLLYSEGGAQRRILAARCLKDKPELGELLKAGQVTLCTIATAARAIREQSAKVEDIVGKSKREVEKVVARANPMPKPKERIKPLVLQAPKAAQVALANPAPQEGFELRFSVSKDVYEKFEEVKRHLSNTLQGELGLEAVFSKLLDNYLKPVRERAKTMSSKTRFVPIALKREIQKRDGAQCSFVAPDGTRCQEKCYLQYDHIVPFSLGGETTAENLRLLCSKHNRFAAEQVFGARFMERAVAGASATGGGRLAALSTEGGAPTANGATNL